MSSAKLATFTTRLITLERRWRAAAAKYGESRLTIALRLLKLYREHRLGPDHALKFGLARPGVTDHTLSGCFNKLEFMALQDRLNPKDLIGLTEDKARFYPHCAALGIPVPAQYAVITRPGRHANLVPGIIREDWLRIAETLPKTFITKPAEGAYGKGVKAWTRANGGFVDHTGRTCSALELYDLLHDDSTYDCHLVQERLQNHPAVVEFTRSTGLQTVRIATLVSADGATVSLLYAEWKLVLQGNVADNFQGGKSGNLIANVELREGTLGSAMTVTPDGADMIVVDSHPTTGRPISGTILPDWDRLIQLVESCAKKLMPLRTIGWDIGLTPNGPVVIEANRWWDPPNNAVIGPHPPGVTENSMIAGAQLLRQAVEDL